MVHFGKRDVTAIVHIYSVHDSGESTSVCFKLDNMFVQQQRELPKYKQDHSEYYYHTWICMDSGYYICVIYKPHTNHNLGAFPFLG